MFCTRALPRTPKTQSRYLAWTLGPAKKHIVWLIVGVMSSKLRLHALRRLFTGLQRGRLAGVAAAVAPLNALLQGSKDPNMRVLGTASQFYDFLRLSLRVWAVGFRIPGSRFGALQASEAYDVG